MTSITSIASLTSPLHAHISQAIVDAGGWLGFDQFMEMALYTPNLGYYASDLRKFGLMPASGGSDFVTAPEISPRFGQALARQVVQALSASATDEVWEFGAGSGALAEQLLQALPQLRRYTIVELSGSLRQRQQARLEGLGATLADKVQWVNQLPDTIKGVVLGNEVLDAIPVKLLARLGCKGVDDAGDAAVWHERGVAIHGGCFVYADRPTDMRPPLELHGTHDYVTEIHPQAEGLVGTLADRLTAGAIFLIDYGFPEHEYYHPQRSMGTVMCHRRHQVDADALNHVGDKDITAHVNFTGIALAGQAAGLQVLGYTGQGRFLLNCGLLDGMVSASIAERAMVQKLVNEHEMGELFKVIAFGAKNTTAWQPMGFAIGDRTHTL